MKTINIEKIIEHAKLDKNEIAKHLFPKNKYPRLALNRVIDNDAVLDANQISKLSLLSGIPIAMLYSEDGWTDEAWSSEIEDHKIVFTNRHYKAELDTKTWSTKIFDKNSLFHEFVIHRDSLKLKDYIELLNAEINKKS